MNKSSKSKHKHQFTIPVEWRYQWAGKSGYYDLGWDDDKSQLKVGRRVTKLRCACGEEINR